MALIPTDFPEPVVPATSKCGILARSTITGLPNMSFPIARGNLKEFFLNTSSSINSLSSVLAANVSASLGGEKINIKEFEYSNKFSDYRKK